MDDSAIIRIECGIIEQTNLFIKVHVSKCRGSISSHLGVGNQLSSLSNSYTYGRGHFRGMIHQWIASLEQLSVETMKTGNYDNECRKTID